MTNGILRFNTNIPVDRPCSGMKDDAWKDAMENRSCSSSRMTVSCTCHP